MLNLSKDDGNQLGQEYFISADETVKQKLAEVMRLWDENLDKEKIAHALVIAFELDLNQSFLKQIKRQIVLEAGEAGMTLGEEFVIQTLEKIAPYGASSEVQSGSHRINSSKSIKRSPKW